MLGTIRRHQKWLWFIIAGLTIISFVIFGPSSANRMSGFGRGGGSLGLLNGKPITQEQYQGAYNEVRLAYFLNSGQWPDKDTSARQMGFNAPRETYIRLFFIEKEKEAGIQVDTATIGRIAANIVRMARITSYDEFVGKILAPEGLSGSDFEAFIRHELGREQLARLTGMSGKLVPPQEAEMLYRREHQDLQAEVAFFPASNYLARVTIIPGALEQYYSNHLATYIIPERRQVSYVKFDATNYQAEALQKLTNLDQIVEANMEKQGTNLYREAKTPEEAKARLREDIIREAELRLAHKPASEFAMELEKAQPPNVEGFAKVAGQKNLAVHVTPPFDEENGPAGMEFPPFFTRSTFKLIQEEPFTGAMKGEDAYYVLALKGTNKVEVPSFQSIHDKVVEDYRREQALELARIDGAGFASTVTNAMAAGKTFEAVCADAKVTPVKLPPFSLSTREMPEVENEISFSLLKQY